MVSQSVNRPAAARSAARGPLAACLGCQRSSAALRPALRPAGMAAEVDAARSAADALRTLCGPLARPLAVEVDAARDASGPTAARSDSLSALAPVYEHQAPARTDRNASVMRSSSLSAIPLADSILERIRQAVRASYGGMPIRGGSSGPTARADAAREPDHDAARAARVDRLERITLRFLDNLDSMSGSHSGFMSATRSDRHSSEKRTATAGWAGWLATGTPQTLKIFETKEER